MNSRAVIGQSTLLVKSLKRSHYIGVEIRTEGNELFVVSDCCKDWVFVYDNGAVTCSKCNLTIWSLADTLTLDHFNSDGWVIRIDGWDNVSLCRWVSDWSGVPIDEIEMTVER